MRIPIPLYFRTRMLPRLLTFCKTCKKETDPEHKDYTIDYRPAFDDDWNHLLATVDVWGKREITCVTADGTPIPKVVPLNTL